jgi:hypothetical protein
MKLQKTSTPFSAERPIATGSKAKVRKSNRKVIFFAVLAFVCFGLASVHAGTVYITADNLEGTNLFGTLDVATGQFSQIASTDPVFLGLTTGPGGKIYGADVNSGHLFTISTSGVTAQFGSVTAPSAFYGLAYSRSAANFFATNLDPMNVTLYSVAGDGNSQSLIGQIAGPNSGFFPTGNLAFGSGGNLYFNYSSDLINGTNSTLYTVNTSTGALTAVGSGLRSGILALFSDGTGLYGIDANLTSDIGVFRIDTTTGIATQVSTVTGLPGDNSFYVDAATVSVPDTGSTLTLLFFALSVVLVGSGVHQCCKLRPEL